MSVCLSGAKPDENTRGMCVCLSVCVTEAEPNQNTRGTSVSLSVSVCLSACVCVHVCVHAVKVSVYFYHDLFTKTFLSLFFFLTIIY